MIDGAGCFFGGILVDTSQVSLLPILLHFAWNEHSEYDRKGLRELDGCFSGELTPTIYVLQYKNQA